MFILFTVDIFIYYYAPVVKLSIANTLEFIHTLVLGERIVKIKNSLRTKKFNLHSCITNWYTRITPGITMLWSDNIKIEKK